MIKKPTTPTARPVPTRQLSTRELAAVAAASFDGQVINAR
jgi:hypothetical protein